MLKSGTASHLRSRLVCLTAALMLAGCEQAAPAAPAEASMTVAQTQPTGGNAPSSSAGRASMPVAMSMTTAAGTAASAPTTAGSTAGAGPARTMTMSMSMTTASAGTGSPAAGTAAAGTTGAAGATSAGAAGIGSPATGNAGTAAPSTSGKVFADCRFHFGAIADVARKDPALIKELDFFTPGWMGLKDTFDMQHVCDDAAQGGAFAGKIPAIVSYLAAFYAKRVGNLEDCNVDPQRNLCVMGASIITRDLSKILGIYENYAQGFAGCYGTTRPIIFMMEPDFFQYTISNQSQPWTPKQAGEIMSQFVNAIKKHLPNAIFSMDISPWVPPDNGSDGGRQWFSNFDMSLFTFVHTSGGHTDGGSAQIRADNKMTWKGVSDASGKPVLADTGYGVNGRSEGEDPVWNDVKNINARIADGVTSLSQYNPEPGWAAKISAMRGQLGQPRFCP